MLGLLEELILLLLRNEGGSFRRVSVMSQRCAIAGAVLMELAAADCIYVDRDGEHLCLRDDTPTGDRLLDPTLADIAAGERQHLLYWIDHVAERADVIRAGTLGRLIGKGILIERDRRFLWVSRPRSYPIVDGHVRQEVILRFREALLSDDIPDSRDVMLIFMVFACDASRTLLSRWERVKSKRRIEQIYELNPIGQTMLQAIHQYFRLNRGYVPRPM